METGEVQINGVRFERQYWQVVQPQLARLMAAGLRVEGPRVSSKKEHEFSFWISKPKLTPGNSVPSARLFSDQWKDDDCDTDAPQLTLATNNGTWVVQNIGRLCPGPGPGDFTHVYDRLDEAIGDILDYYFGDPTRMQMKWRATGVG